MRNGLEWDQITAMATTAYNYFPNMSAKESAFFLMYGRDPMNKLSSILNAPRRYLCDDSGLPDLEALKNMYQMVAQQLYNSRQHYIKDNKYNKVPGHGILVGDLVLMKDHTAKLFEPKYKEDYRVVQIYGTNALQVSDKRGKLHNVHITDVRLINMTKKVETPLEQIYVVPPQSWGDRSDTKHSKCLLLGGRRLNQLTLIPKPKGSGGARAATAQVGPANKRNDTKRCLPIEASLRPGEAVPW